MKKLFSGISFIYFCFLLCSCGRVTDCQITKGNFRNSYEYCVINKNITPQKDSIKLAKGDMELNQDPPLVIIKSFVDRQNKVSQAFNKNLEKNKSK